MSAADCGCRLEWPTDEMPWRESGECKYAGLKNENDALRTAIIQFFREFNPEHQKNCAVNGPSWFDCAPVDTRCDCGAEYAIHIAHEIFDKVTLK